MSTGRLAGGAEGAPTVTGPRLRSTSAIRARTTPVARAATVATPAPASRDQGRRSAGAGPDRDGSEAVAQARTRLVGRPTGEVLAKAGLEDVVGHDRSSDPRSRAVRNRRSA